MMLRCVRGCLRRQQSANETPSSDGRGRGVAAGAMVRRAHVLGVSGSVSWRRRAVREGGRRDWTGEASRIAHETASGPHHASHHHQHIRSAANAPVDLSGRLRPASHVGLYSLSSTMRHEVHGGVRPIGGTGRDGASLCQSIFLTCTSHHQPKHAALRWPAPPRPPHGDDKPPAITHTATELCGHHRRRQLSAAGRSAPWLHSQARPAGARA